MSTWPELGWEAVDAAYDERALSRRRDAIVTGNMPAFEGVNLPEHWGAGHWGAYRKPVLRITTGGTTGGSVGHASLLRGSPPGSYDTVIAIAFEKQSDGDSTMG